MSSISYIWDILHGIGGVLVTDDMKDFPWNPWTDGDPWTGSGGHMPGMPHHGMIGFLMQQVAYLGAMADVGAELARELGDKDEIDEIIEETEAMAYPLPEM